MALRAGYKGIKKVGSGLNLSKDGVLSSTGGGPGGETALSDLSDVSIISPSDGQVLQYDATSQKWVNHINVPGYITIPVDIYSAASDTVTYIDETGQKTVTTDADGHGQASINCANGDSITFTSSVAKNPSNLSEAYSKTVLVTLATTEVSVMPDNSLYWYGFESDNIEDATAANGWSYNNNTTLETPTHQTNSILCDVAGTSRGKFIGSKNAFSGNTVNVIYKITKTVGSFAAFMYWTSTKSVTDTVEAYVLLNPTVNTITKDSMNISTHPNEYVILGTLNDRSIEIYALWYE